MKQWTISSTAELSFIFAAVIWDSNVSDMKFGWLDLFASRMSSYLNGTALFPSNSGSSPSWSGAGEFVPLVSIESSLYGMLVIPAVPYMLTGFAGCSVSRGISREGIWKRIKSSISLGPSIPHLSPPELSLPPSLLRLSETAAAKKASDFCQDCSAGLEYEVKA
ncbi:hypothetical protein NC651_007839 [Populus alba x Populus x berolinensis]|nr:hypothetical protein NC651_007839 [Populus alba x Populus x berolinensis]